MDDTIASVCLNSCTDCTTCNCDLMLMAGAGTCDALTVPGLDTYEATFTFSQTTAPGAGTYTLSTTSGGTIGGDDPNTMTSGTITISGIIEGTDADLNIIDGIGCDLNSSVTSPVCLPSYNITYQVNMCEMISAGTFDPATQALFVAGGVNYPACGAAMTDANGDNVYEVVRSHLDTTTVLYKFYIATPADANTGNCCCGGFEANIPAACTFGPFADRQYIVNGMDDTIAPVCYDDCSDCTGCSAGPCDPNYAGPNQLTGTESGMADYETDGNIESDQIIEATAVVDYDSGMDVILLPGFNTAIGAVFRAFIDGCGGAMFGGDDSDNNALKIGDQKTESTLDKSKK